MATALFAFVVCATGGRAGADDSLPVIAGGREQEILALLRPHGIGKALSAGFTVAGVNISKESIRVEVRGPGHAGAAIRLELAERNPSAESTPSFAVHRERSSAIGKANDGADAALDALVAAIRTNDHGGFWPPRTVPAPPRAEIEAPPPPRPPGQVGTAPPPPPPGSAAASVTKRHGPLAYLVQGAFALLLATVLLLVFRSAKKDAQTGTARRHRAFAAILALVGIAGGLGIAEAYVRIAKPKPPVQAVRGHNLHLIGDTPVWEWSTDREPRACAEAHPERTRILFLGSSITHGMDAVAPDRVFTRLLEDRLNTLRPNPGFCVMNFAQVGFTSQQKEAVASVEIPRYRPALVMWEGWNEFAQFVLLGDGAYELRTYDLRADGFPGIGGVPDPVNRLLFVHSRLYEYLTLKFGSRADTDEMTPARARLERLYAATQAVGSRLAVYEAPPLDRPFGVGRSNNGVMDEFVRNHHVPYFELGQMLKDRDYLALRLDPCCHYNTEGHQVLAPLFEHIVLDVLDGKNPPR